MLKLRGRSEKIQKAEQRQNHESNNVAIFMQLLRSILIPTGIKQKEKDDSKFVKYIQNIENFCQLDYIEG
jgi:penicillin V acylase-like amidase (Ntn superfamily)